MKKILENVYDTYNHRMKCGEICGTLTTNCGSYIGSCGMFIVIEEDDEQETERDGIHGEWNGETSK